MGARKDPASIVQAALQTLPVFACRSIMTRMTEPKLTVLGVYRPQISSETWKEQWHVTEDDKETQEHFDSLVLIEAVVDDLGEPFDMSRLGQINLAFRDDAAQMMVGYDEGLLSSDGETLIERRMDCIEGSGALRFAVYLHQYDANRPLQWQGGHVLCPPVQDAPARLMMLMPYNACS
jgi:hypothetical protein